MGLLDKPENLELYSELLIRLWNLCLTFASEAKPKINKDGDSGAAPARPVFRPGDRKLWFLC